MKAFSTFRRTSFTISVLFSMAWTATVLAAPLDIGIFTDTSGGESLSVNGGSTLTHDFDNGAIRSTAGISLNGTSDGVNLDAGHYLVMYNSLFNSSGGSERREIQTKLNLAGTDLPIGWSQDYIRRQDDQDEAITTGAGIINVATTGDLLQLQSFRTDNENNPTTRGAQTGLQVLKLDDSWDYLSLSRATTDQTGPTSQGTTNAVEVTYNSIDEANANFGFASDSSNITLSEGGKYLVVANTYLTTPAADDDRHVFTQRLTLDDTEVVGTRTGVYIRGNPNSDSANDGAAAITTIIDATAGQELSVNIFNEPGTNSPGDGTIKADMTALTIVKLPDSANYLHLTETAGTQDINDANAVTWGTQVEPGSPTFTHTAGASEVSVDADGDYLFLTTLYTDDTGATRGYPESFFELNDTTTTTFGRSGFYTRNASDGSGDGQSGGDFNGILLALTAGDSVELMMNPLGNTGTLNLDYGSFLGLQLSSLRSTQVAEVPEPSSFLLALLGMLSMGSLAWRRRSRA